MTAKLGPRSRPAGALAVGAAFTRLSAAAPPHLPDMAWLERARERAGRAADAAPIEAAVAAQAPADPEGGGPAAGPAAVAAAGRVALRGGFALGRAPGRRRPARARFIARCADGAAFGADAADAAFARVGTLARLLRHGARCGLQPAPAR